MKICVQTGSYGSWAFEGLHSDKLTGECGQYFCSGQALVYQCREEAQKSPSLGKDATTQNQDSRHCCHHNSLTLVFSFSQGH